MCLISLGSSNLTIDWLPILRSWVNIRPRDRQQYLLPNLGQLFRLKRTFFRRLRKGLRILSVPSPCSVFPFWPRNLDLLGASLRTHAPEVDMIFQRKFAKNPEILFVFYFAIHSLASLEGESLKVP